MWVASKRGSVNCPQASSNGGCVRPRTTRSWCWVRCCWATSDVRIRRWRTAAAHVREGQLVALGRRGVSACRELGQLVEVRSYDEAGR